jgi:hypothetical protein
MIHLVLFFMLIIASVFAAVPEPKQPVGFGRPFISGGKKWSSTGMGGLDHHYPEVPIEEVEFASKKSKRKPEDPIVHPEGECSDSNQPELDTLLSLTFILRPLPFQQVSTPSRSTLMQVAPSHLTIKRRSI